MRSFRLTNGKVVKLNDSVHKSNICAAEGTFSGLILKWDGIVHAHKLVETDNPVVINSKSWLHVQDGEVKHLELGDRYDMKTNTSKPFYLAGIIRAGKLYAVVRKAPKNLDWLKTPVAPFRVTGINVWQGLFTRNVADNNYYGSN